MDEAEKAASGCDARMVGMIADMEVWSYGRLTLPTRGRTLAVQTLLYENSSSLSCCAGGTA